MKTLTTEQLQAMRERNEDFALINVLPEEMYRKEHIAASDNIPVGDDEFLQKVEQKVGGKDQPIVVYCANTQCDASPTAAKKLEDAGFTNVSDYEGGTAAWKEAGLPLEGVGATTSA